MDEEDQLAGQLVSPGLRLGGGPAGREKRTEPGQVQRGGGVFAGIGEMRHRAGQAAGADIDVAHRPADQVGIGIGAGAFGRTEQDRPVSGRWRRRGQKRRFRLCSGTN